MIGIFCTKRADDNVRKNKKSIRLYMLLCLFTVGLYCVMRAIVRNKRGNL